MKTWIVTRLAAAILAANGGQLDAVGTDAHGRHVGTFVLPATAEFRPTRWDGQCWRTVVSLPSGDDLRMTWCGGWPRPRLDSADRVPGSIDN